MDAFAQNTQQKHPRLLYVLFFTEIWERFAYYAMLGGFTIYLNEHLHMKQKDANGVYGIFTALVYVFPLLGGFLADRALGFRRSVVLGGGLMCVGYAILAFVALTATEFTWFIYIGLVIIGIGNGFFKPNMATMVGNLYAKGDSRRDTAFSIFYMGVNIGAFFGPIVFGTLRGGYWGASQHWWLGFAATSLGMVFAIITFLCFWSKLRIADNTSSLSAVVQVALPKQFQDPRDSKEVERRRIISIFGLCIVVIVFWMVFHQNGTTLNSWAKEHTDLTLGGMLHRGLKPEFFQSINPFFIVFLTPIVVGFHKWLAKKGKDLATPYKIAMGMLLIGMAYVAMVAASVMGGHTIGPCNRCMSSDHPFLKVFFIGVHDGQVSSLWLVLTYLVTTIGELYLSPMGLSLVSKLAPARMAGLMMSIWNLATAVGNKLVGDTGERLWPAWPHHKFFGLLIICCLIAAGLLLAFAPYMKKALPKERKD